MAHTMFDNRGTQFAVDWGAVERLNLSYYRAVDQYNSAQIVRMDESTWYNPFSRSLPRTSTVNVDWTRVRERSKAASQADMLRFGNLARHDMRSVVGARDWQCTGGR